ncbi:putative vegetative incompatibility protein HET-E-1 [Rosellinia necatrix]|uniref:Putative vegetative incompatibility protein HET-E-1 n=1 Tax=Rosellinia necatrix TaxID=77044 RepID=A0A1W2TE83_ROSNE|nr:putative vegetative incompatibility protein HET-E-1 [Rosellinia necatrix]
MAHSKTDAPDANSRRANVLTGIAGVSPSKRLALSKVSMPTAGNLEAEPDKLGSSSTRIRPSQSQPTSFTIPQLPEAGSVVSMAPFQIQRPQTTPMHMFDVDTMNLCHYPRLGNDSQYCIVSHNWKGNEVTYDDVLSSRKWAMRDITNIASRELALAEARSQAEFDAALRLAYKDKPGVRTEAKNDVERIKDKCHHNVKMQIASIYLLANGRDSPEQPTSSDYPNKAASDFGLSTSMSSNDVARRLLGLKELCDWKMAETGNNAENFARLRNTFEEEFEYPEFEMLGKAFRTHGHFSEAVEELVSCLQRWRSALKIEQCVIHAREIFGRGIFGHAAVASPTAKRYVWLDTCCVNRADSFEYSKSISLMGDWYAHASFCLVLLDTRNANSPEKCRNHPQRQRCCAKKCGLYMKRRELASEWSEELRLFDAGNEVAKALAAETIRRQRVVNIARFAAISESKPQWSERGWTLQELILSKSTFFFNAAWEPLPRPVENLGAYYFLAPLISVYARPRPEIANFWTIDALEELASAVGYSYKLPSPPFTFVADTHTSVGAERTTPSDLTRVCIALHLIELLDCLGIQIPANLTKENAFSRLTDIIRHAQNKYACDEKRMTVFEVLTEYLKKRGMIVEALPREDEAAGSSLGVTSEVSIETWFQPIYKAVVNYLLCSLTSVLGNLIPIDRSYIAEFGNIKGLDDWCEGTIRYGFTAEAVLSIARTRKCTFEVDQAYSLMGICNVRFPPFAPEGLPHALARLLDQIVIAHNDVSVFNWSGIHYGSSIRGRSMYPSSLEAYSSRRTTEDEYRKVQGDDERLSCSSDELNRQGIDGKVTHDDHRRQERRERELRGNNQRQLALRAKTDRVEVQSTYKKTFDMLRETIRLVKKEGATVIPIRWMQGIIRFVSLSHPNRIHCHLEEISKILNYIKSELLLTKKPEPCPRLVRNKTQCVDDFAVGAVSNERSSSVKVPRSGAFVKPNTPALAIAKATATPHPTRSPIKRSFSLTKLLDAPRPSKFRKHKCSKREPREAAGLSNPPTPASRRDQVMYFKPTPFCIVTLLAVPNQASKIIDVNAATTRSVEPVLPPDNSKTGRCTLKRLDTDVQEFLWDITPREWLRRASGAGHGREAKTGGGGKDKENEQDDDTCDCINNNNPDVYEYDDSPLGPQDAAASLGKLPKDIRVTRVAINSPPPPSPRICVDGTNSVAPNPIIINNAGIEGIFDIQRVIVRIEDAHLLQNVVATAASPHQTIKGTCTISTGIMTVAVNFLCEACVLEKQLRVSAAVSAIIAGEQGDAGDNGNITKETARADGVAEGLPEGSADGDEDDEDATTRLNYTRKERMAVRMIGFVEEPNVGNVVGEWVLARFSGVPRANWFLCQLEAGPGNRLQGRRIPSDGIDFQAGVPEPLLQAAWLTSLERRKNMHCRALLAYLHSGPPPTNIPCAKPPGAMPGPDEMGDTACRQGNDVNTNGDEEEMARIGRFVGSLAGAGRTVGAETVDDTVCTVMERHVGVLERAVAAEALKRSPRKLRQAIDTLDRSGHWLLSTFHACKPIHML